MQIEINQPILGFNDRQADQNHQMLQTAGVYLVDILASPGAGKTSVILATIAQLRSQLRIAVIEGDLASDLDAQRVKAEGIPAIQINTGGACHLEAAMVAQALAQLPCSELDLILVENVGNLVCPTEFAIGADLRVVIASVPEGDDKPQKYPGIFSIADAVLLNKIDTLALFDFDLVAYEQRLRALNPPVRFFPLSARNLSGVREWCDWLLAKVRPID
ncbi:MAG: hydrogenase nickel incorporation protein HypB [Actinomycetia bacterium]|nr:hydrogenase nickel incorporation protein HypB [Actinomycetes bacterium]